MSLLSKNKISQLDNVDIEVFKDVDLSKYSTMKLSSHGDLVKVRSLIALQDLLKVFLDEQIPYRVIGWGANFILPKEPDFVLIKLDLPFDKNSINDQENEFSLSATAPLNVLSSIASKYGLSGWEVFTGVPASLGGAIAMNAGTSLGEIGELIKDVTVLSSTGMIKKIDIDKNSFSYRKNNFLNEGDIIVEATIFHKGIDPTVAETIKTYLQKRTESQPLREKTCGCMFKNTITQINGNSVTCRAGQYIDIMGLKGLSWGQMRISPKHANFMENKGSSNSDEVKKLVAIALEELEFHYGVKFETEVHLP
ncbi:MAG: FAD-binding protein [Bacteriovoracaceae bacterium]|nr:FAD-binding protein [Bacteriovoracaceae bacterium]